MADLHLEKGSSFAAWHGQFLPPYDTRETLRRLAGVIDRLQPDAVVSLGDSVHDSDGWERMGEAEREMLATLEYACRWTWIAGNHDPADAAQSGENNALTAREIPLETGTAAFPDTCAAKANAGQPHRASVDELQVGDIVLRHEPTAEAEQHEIAGHLHPAAKVATPRGTVRRRCFVADGRRLILPAFGSFTGGLNVCDAAFAPLLDRATLFIGAIGRTGVYPIPPRMLVGD